MFSTIILIQIRKMACLELYTFEHKFHFESTTHQEINHLWRPYPSSCMPLQELAACQGPRPKAGPRPKPDFGNLGTWKSRKLESTKSEKYKFSIFQIRSAQNLGNVWIIQKKTFGVSLGAIPGHFSMDRKH